MLLKNKVAFVSGGSRGIGSKISQVLAANGAKVVVGYYENVQQAKAVVEAIRQSGGSAVESKFDVTKRSEVTRAVDLCIKQFGALDILVNNAGINAPCDFDQISDEAWDRVLEVNLKGPFICTQVAYPFLRLNKGSIINIGSVSGQYGGPRTAHYAASKAGLISLSQVIARFGGKDGVRSNTIAVGLVESEMAAAGLADPSVRKASENIVLGRLGTFDEVADAVLFLSSSRSSYVTAQTINVNGGLYF